MSISRRATAFINALRPGRSLRPLTPDMPASSKMRTTAQPWRSATAINSRRWFSVVCSDVETRRYRPTRQSPDLGCAIVASVLRSGLGDELGELPEKSVDGRRQGSSMLAALDPPGHRILDDGFK